MIQNSWMSDYRDSIKDQSTLESLLSTTLDKTPYPILIPKHIAQKIKDDGLDSPLAKQFIPSRLENDREAGLIDPIGDQKFEKPGGIIHRYKNRILYSPTTICPINCRYCFRKNELFENLDTFKASLKELESYLQTHIEVEEVILTGGDPLILSNKKLKEILTTLATFKHIKYVRIHSRTPIILPARMDEELLELFKGFENNFDTISIAIHVNHESEISEEFEKNIIPFQRFNLLSQSVLLKGVNDNIESLVNLYKRINKLKIKPYYLHHPDLVKGAMHFYIPLELGRKIYGTLRDELPGWLIPHYIIDSSLGTGKNLAYNSENLVPTGKILDRFGQTHSIDIQKIVD